MIRFALVCSASLFLAAPAIAQGFTGSFTGSWGCRNDTSAKAGIVTIYGSVYGYASATMGSGASGTGSITAYTDGAGINDGPLRTSAGIEAARLIPDPNYGTAMQLETADRILLLCTPL